MIKFGKDLAKDPIFVEALEAARKESNRKAAGFCTNRVKDGKLCPEPALPNNMHCFECDKAIAAEMAIEDAEEEAFDATPEGKAFNEEMNKALFDKTPGPQ